MSARPWFKFYTADWRADAALRMCSLAARGLWLEMVCIMDEAQPRGHLVVKGRPVAPRQLAILAGAMPQEVDKLLIELEEAGVFSRVNGTIVNRRMVRETRVSEEQRGRAASRWTDAENADLFGSGNAGTMPRVQSLEARDQNPEDQNPGNDVREAAREIWAEAPAAARKRSSKGELERALAAAKGRRKNLSIIRVSRRAYYESADATKENGKFAKGVHRMVEQDRWEDWTPEDVTHLGSGPSDMQQRQWRYWMEDWLKDPTKWRPERGPAPDSPGCKIPPEIMAEFDYRPPGRRSAS